MGKVLAVCVSQIKGVPKEDVGWAECIADYGLKGDAHAGSGHRQVSLLAHEQIAAFRAQGAEVTHGAFGENIVAEGIDFAALPVGTRLRAGEALLEITQIGKECHDRCAIYQRMGDCIMPREGVFAKVLAGGIIRAGDTVHIEHDAYRVAVITVSDRSYAGLRVDESGQLAVDKVLSHGYTVTNQGVIPDERAVIEAELVRYCDSGGVDLILTTGGTGFSPRDVTPEATLAVAERNAPGIAQAITAHSLTITERAMLSRGVSVIRGKTLIVNLPGSPKAVGEILDYILPTLAHGLDILTGRDSDCGSHLKETSK